MLPSDLKLQTWKTEQVLKKFSQICVNAVINQPNIDLEELKSVMKALGHQHVANFLTRCFNGTQVLSTTVTNTMLCYNKLRQANWWCESK